MWLIGFPQKVQGQTVVGFNVPTSMCEGSSQTVTFGFSSLRNIVIEEIRTSLGHSERIFLPDGVPCGTMGCAYRSHVQFSAFTPGSSITSEQDIQYVRLNIEHSWIGDIYIGITCPNDQKASLLKYSDNGSSSCSSTIPEEHRGWDLTRNNVQVGTYLGNALDGENPSHPCDSTASGNGPGNGWNYCWSNNTTSGYSYAHSSATDDGFIYRSGHAHGGKIDSSNVTAKTNFYHPDQSFSSLIGCPLNGDWYIEVLDGWGGDNGYIFEWEIALNAQLVQDCLADSFMVTGYGVTMLNDSTFTIQAPSHVDHDTTVYYNYHIYSSCGNDFDTLVALTFHPTYLTHLDTTTCENIPLYIDTTTLSQSGDYFITLSSMWQCDSILQVSLLTHPQNHTHLYDTVCKGNGYTLDGIYYGESGTYTRQFTNVYGCDSLVTLHLGILHENLTAQIKATPPIVSLNHPLVNLHDRSLYNTSRLWFIDGHTYNDPYLTYNYPLDADSLPVTLVAISEEGCTDTASTVIYIDRAIVYTPNVFTPDESINNTWQPALSDIQSMELWIYNRQGILISHLEGTDASWDGTSNGTPCPQGAYVYTLLYRSNMQPYKQQKINGTILLLR